MAYTFIYKGMIFIEGAEPSAKILGRIEYEKFLTFNSQLKTIECVKDQLIEKTIAMGGNAIIEFKYGQKSSSWIKSSLFSLDDNVEWYGTGLAVVIPQETRNKIIDKLSKL